MVSTADHDDPIGARSDTGMAVLADHDPTLKWIVSDLAEGNEQTPPPLPSRNSERTPPLEKTPVGERTPPPEKTPVGERTPPLEKTPVGERTPSPEKTPRAAMRAVDFKGAEPDEFLAADPTPPPPSASPLAEVLGAEPTAILPGPMGSDSELPADAVEIIPHSADEVGATPSASDLADTPPDGISTRPDASKPQTSAAAEPREVEPDVLEMMESAEHLTSAEPEAPDVRQSPTPPPVPVEASGPAALAPQTPPQAPPLFEENAAAIGESQIPEALARRSLKKRSKPWFEEVFDEDFLRTLPFSTPEQTAREVTFIRQALSPPAGGEILDLACGYGRHALELAQTGLRMTGLDLSLPLLIRAADTAQRRGLAVNFVHADMREMTFDSRFDAAYCVLSSFGYFDEETNLRVASGICRALKPGGRFLLDIINRDYIVADLPSRVWWEGDGCVVLEEVDFNYHTSRVLIRRSVVFGDGRQVEQEISMRAYSLHEVGKLLCQAGFRVLEVSGGLAVRSKFFGSASRNIIAVCERPVP
jgi:SAM-dependent methyltransferase